MDEGIGFYNLCLITSNRPSLSDNIDPGYWAEFKTTVRSWQEIIEFLLDYPDRTYGDALANLYDEILNEPSDYNLSHSQVLIFILAQFE